MTYATYMSGQRWHVMRIVDGNSVVICDCALDKELAERIRDLLQCEARINVLLSRHGLVDVPLEDIER